MFDGYLIPEKETPAVEAKPEIFSPDHFENWLAAMPRKTTYEWFGHCLYQQYGEYCGVEVGFGAYIAAIQGLKRHTGQAPGAGEPFRFVALKHPRTFGAALRRLRTQRHGALGALRIYFHEWRTRSLIRQRKG